MTDPLPGRLPDCFNQAMRMRVAAVVAGAVLALGITGCGGSEGADGSSPSADATDRVSISTPTAIPTVTVSPPGKVKVTAGLPAGFPAAVPLYDARIIAGAPGEPGAPFDWSVVLQPTGDPAAIADAAAKLLENAGFTAGNGIAQPRLQVLQYSDSAYVVGVTVAKTGDGITMTYTVSAK